MKNNKRSGSVKINKAARACVHPGCNRLTLRTLCGPCRTTEELRRIFSGVAAQDR